MIVLECKLKGKEEQYRLLDEAVRTALFVRNKSVRYWLDNQGVGRKELMRHNTQLRAEFEWCKKLNSHATQASVDRAWFAITRFYSNCKTQIKGSRGFPKFKKQGHSVEYKTSGWKLSEDKKSLTFTDGFKVGKFKLIGTRDLNFSAINQIKRVRAVKRADGYYAQFIIDIERHEKHESTGKQLGIDLGLEFFYIDILAVNLSENKIAAANIVTKGWSNCSCPILAIPPIDIPLYQAKKARNILMKLT